MLCNLLKSIRPYIIVAYGIDFNSSFEVLLLQFELLQQQVAIIITSELHELKNGSSFLL